MVELWVKVCFYVVKFCVGGIWKFVMFCIISSGVCRVCVVLMVL